jgi:hypothetical protein
MSHVPLLVVGAILAPGRRMVSTALRTVGLRQGRTYQTYQTYHRVLTRAAWSSLGASRILLRLLVSTFAPNGPVVLGIDATIERRREDEAPRLPQLVSIEIRCAPVPHS